MQDRIDSSSLDKADGLACNKLSMPCVSASLREICLALVVAIGANPLASVAEELAAGPMIPDAAKIVGSDECAKCHENEVKQWMQTPHFATFEELHRKPRAKDIADKLAVSSIKRNKVCTQCHYTLQTQEGRERVVAGVSCESCHGGALSWLKLHADYGGEKVTRAMETPAHREKRVADSIAQGMNNPHNVYLIARQCYDCHTVPNEKLVNVGGHLAGSAEFELVAWSQGKVRHNFARTGGKVNATATPEELRKLFVVGVLTDLEYSLRAVAVATEKATFGVTSAQRAARMKKRLLEVQTLINDPFVQSSLDAAATVELRLGNQAAINAAADAVGKAANEFALHADGARLAPVDPLLPQPAQYKN